ncbi:hypothetical protein ACF09I_35565 [Streptomyces sp. NPDC014940]|uniref:hypothetical protein n=1 Tax=Streptomyces sp. NPDC014940 TaxID=3364932 RepID=UPI0036F860A7
MLKAIRSLTSRFRREVPGVAPTPAPSGLFSADEMPPAADIAAAAANFHRAADQGRAADRAKRAARKLLDRLPAGRYGAWEVERVASNRQTADLDAIRRIFREHGLGEVPMKTAAPSLKVTRAAADTLPAPVLAEAA